MKRYIGAILAFFLLVSCAAVSIPDVYASAKIDESRAIAIVFDNSGSMYIDGGQAWCRATYAMEVFASMLNTGDVLQIYPMWEISANGKKYTMENPLQITDAAQASVIRDIFTENASGTPIESIDCAISGLQALDASKKYLIVLTDGGTFSKNNNGLTKERTKRELDKRIQTYAGESMSFMYLGIGSDACIPDEEPSEYFVKKQAVNTADVLSTLTELCNQIFGRDTLPKNRITGNAMEFDISMSKLIVFVQGENISDLKISGESVGKQISTQQTKYSTRGAGDYKSVPDTSLQGMMVTYADCAAGKYDITYTGTASSVEVYYEPDADLDFVFTDAAGNMVDHNALYEGDYKVSFGMKDAKTGELISSDLLGNPSYQGCCSIDGREIPITYEGFSGSVDVPLKMGEKFAANLTVTYLSGYSISKDSSDFGWSESGIEVEARPAGKLELEISGGEDAYALQDLEGSEPYQAIVYYQGARLTGEELKKVELSWDAECSHAAIRKEFADDHWNLFLCYKDPSAPQETVCGACSIPIGAFYRAQGSNEAQAQCVLTYDIQDDSTPVQVELSVPETYIVIGNLQESQEILVYLKQNGVPLTPGEFQAVTLHTDCDGLEHSVTACEQESAFRMKLLPTEGIAEGNYRIQVTAQYTDPIGRETQASDSCIITLSHVPVWVRWTIGILLVLLLIAIGWMIMHIRVLPKQMHTSRKLSSMNFDGDDVTQSTTFTAEIRKKGAKAQAQFAGKRFGVSMDVTPGKESYLYKPSKRRSAEVKAPSVKKFGPAKIQEAMIGSAKYVADETSGKLMPALPNQRPFALTNGTMIKYSGTIQDAGMEKDFEVTSKLNFKKK